MSVILRLENERVVTFEILEDYVAIHYLPKVCPNGACNGNFFLLTPFLGKIPVVATVCFLKMDWGCEMDGVESLEKMGVKVIYNFDLNKDSLPRKFIQFEAKYRPVTSTAS